MNTIKSIESEMIRIVNEERTRRGLKALNPSPLLCAIARSHSKVQLMHRDIFHESPEDGSKHDRRMSAGGYRFKGCAENVSTAPTLAMSHNGLMNSPGHFKNIVGDWEEIGIGIEKDWDGQLYVTQLFANPVKLIDTNTMREQMLDKLMQFRINKKLRPIPHVSSDVINRLIREEYCEINDRLFDRILNELRGKLNFQKARIFQFRGFENPHHEEQMRLVLQPNLKAISLDFYQCKSNGLLRGIFLFLE